MTDTPMTCAALEQELPAYLRGELSDVRVEQLEQHAAGCAHCEVRLEQVTRLTQPLVVPAPDDLRRAVLQEVQAQRMARTTTLMAGPWRRRAWVATCAVAATVAIMIARRDFTGSDIGTGAVDTIALGPSAAPTSDDVLTQASGMQRVSAQLAAERAQAEFRELDAAATEIESALAGSPADAELRAYLSSVRARRDELSRRVKEAAS